MSSLTLMRQTGNMSWQQIVEVLDILDILDKISVSVLLHDKLARWSPMSEERCKF